MPGQEVELSVVIPSYQGKEKLGKTLPLLKEQKVDCAYEIVVVIDGSRDGSKELMQELADNHLRMIWHDEKRGRGAARNSGIRKARGEFIVFLDDDMTVKPDFLAQHLRLLREERMVVSLGQIRISLPPGVSPLVRYQAGVRQRLDKIQSAQGRNVDFCYGNSGNFAVAREHLLAVGLFDETFRSYGFEDIELSYRLTRQGVRLSHNPEARAEHRFELASTEQYAHRRFLNARAAVRFAAKYPEAAARAGIGVAVVFYGSGGRRLKNVGAHILFNTCTIKTWEKLAGALSWEKHKSCLDKLYDRIFGYYHRKGIRKALAELPAAKRREIVRALGERKMM